MTPFLGVLTLTFFLAQDVLAERVRPALSHRPITYELQWKNDSNQAVLLSAASTAKPADECSIDWSKVPPTPPRGTARLPVTCNWGSFGDRSSSFRSKKFLLQATEAGTRKRIQTSVQLETEVYPSLHFTDEEDTCEQRKERCGKLPYRPRVKLCFVDKEDSEKDFQNAWAVECAGMKTVKIGMMHEIGRAIKNVTDNECGIIEDIRMFGHATEALITIGGSIDGASDFWIAFYGISRCAISKDLKIVYKGCNSGHGCLGQINMVAIADHLTKEKSTTLSPTNYVVNFDFTLFKGGSINFKERKLTAFRNHKTGDLTNEKFEFVGKTSGIGTSPTLADGCSEKCDELNRELKKQQWYWNSMASACHKKLAGDVSARLLFTILTLNDCKSWKGKTVEQLSNSLSKEEDRGRSGLKILYERLTEAMKMIEDSKNLIGETKTICSSGMATSVLRQKSLAPSEPTINDIPQADSTAVSSEIEN